MAAENSAPRPDIVVPCINEEEVLPETARRLIALLKALTVQEGPC
jgi:hypothetical protein